MVSKVVTLIQATKSRPTPPRVGLTTRSLQCVVVPLRMAMTMVIWRTLCPLLALVAGTRILQALVAEPHIVACLGALKVAALTYMGDAYDVAAAAS